MFNSLTKYFISIFCFLAASAHASFGSCQWGNLCVQGEWLYFRSAVDSSIVATSLTEGLVTNERLVNFTPHFDSGWRVAANYRFCDCPYGFFARWTQFESHDSKSLFGNLLTLPNVPLVGLGSGNTKLRFRYHAFDGLFHLNLVCCDCFSLDALGGVHYVWTEAKERVSYASEEVLATANQRSRFSGVGPELGLDFHYHFWNNFSISGRGLASILASRTELVQNSVVIFSFPFETPRTWRAIPYGNIRFGLKYTFGCLFVEGGYEAIAYINALPMLSSSGAIDFELSWKNSSLHGPYIAAGVCF